MMDIRRYFTSLTPRETSASNNLTSKPKMNNDLKTKKRKQDTLCLVDNEEPIPKKRGRKKKVIADEEDPIPKSEALKKNQMKNSSQLNGYDVTMLEDIVSEAKAINDIVRNEDVVFTPTKKQGNARKNIAIQESPNTRSKAAISPLKTSYIDEKKKTVSPKVSKSPVNQKGKNESPISKRADLKRSPNKIPFNIDDKPLGKSTSHKVMVNSIEKNVPNSEATAIASQMFVDKYKPTTSKQLIGQQGDRSNAKKLANWLMNWHLNSDKKPMYNRGGMSDETSGFRAALLSGPPGVGKTTTATVISKELGFDIAELNASDARNKKSLEEHVSTLLHNKVLSNFMSTPNGTKKDGTKHVLIMDEVDGMAGNEDRGGVQELIQLIKKTQIPIICICNDRSHPKIRSLVNYCYDLRFYKPTVEQIKAAMMSLCFKEKIKVSNDVLHELILSTNRDIRQVLHSISLFSAKDHDINKMMSTCSLKDIKLGPFDAVKKVFTAGPEYNEMSFKDKSDLFFMDYSLMSLFCFENYIKVNPAAAKKNEAERLKLAAKSIDAMAFGDLIEREIRTANNWSLLPVQAVFSTVMPSTYMNGTMPHLSSFPALLGKISATNRKDRLLQELSTHMSLTTSGDKSSLNLDYLEPLRLVITHPLITKGNDGVKDVLEILHSYNLLKEDIDTIMELSLWSDEKNPMTKVDSKTKAALTRAYNKDGELLPYDSQDIKKGKKVTATVSDEIAEYGEEDEAVDSEKEDDFALRAKKKVAKKTAKETKESDKPKAQKPKTTAKRGRKKQ